MDKFKRGQLVRYARNGGAVPRGAVGEVTTKRYENFFGLGYDVEFPGCPSPHKTGQWHVAEDRLVPVIDDGSQASSWAAGVWKPKWVKV
jgi:hypothetical protein